MNTFEKMLFLKSIPLFKYVKDDALLGVAALLEEQLIQPEKVVLEKGELSASMYMIVTGKVKVHDKDRTFKELGEREVFGELAALSPQKRIASITALEETLLLKISNRLLYDLMEMQIGLTKGIIQILCQRIRTMANDLSQA